MYQWNVGYMDSIRLFRYPVYAACFVSIFQRIEHHYMEWFGIHEL